jgi:hypothetical protein
MSSHTSFLAPGSLAAARASAGAQRALEGREVVKEIVRAPKLVNFVVET